MSEPVILIADDQTHVIEALRLLLKGEGYRTESATSPAGVLSSIESRNFDCILMDLNYARDTTSGAEGLDLLSRLQSMDATAPVVVMTAWGTVELAQALRKGQRLEAENRVLRDQKRPSLIAESPGMRSILDVVARVGPSNA